MSFAAQMLRQVPSFSLSVTIHVNYSLLLVFLTFHVLSLLVIASIRLGTLEEFIMLIRAEQVAGREFEDRGKSWSMKQVSNLSYLFIISSPVGLKPWCV